MKVQLREELSTKNPDDVAALAARGDYMEDSLVDKDIHEVLQGVSTDSDDYCPQESLEVIHERLLRRGHFGPYEHPQAFFVCEGVSRVCMAQVTRHRHMSFDVQSMRYCSFEDSDVKVPPTFVDENEIAPEKWKQVCKRHFEKSVTVYKEMVEDGIPKEDARFVLPVGTKVNMSFSANARTLMHLIDMRHSGDTQWEARNFAKQVLDEASEWSPITFSMYRDHAKGSSKKAP